MSQDGKPEPGLEQSTDGVEGVETVHPSRHNPNEVVREDVMSDPALGDHLGSDWSDEGGAAPEGPATFLADGEHE